MVVEGMQSFLNFYCLIVQAGRIEESTVMLKALLRRWEEGDHMGFRVQTPSNMPI